MLRQGAEKEEAGISFDRGFANGLDIYQVALHSENVLCAPGGMILFAQ